MFPLTSVDSCTSYTSIHKVASDHISIYCILLQCKEVRNYSAVDYNIAMCVVRV